LLKLLIERVELRHNQSQIEATIVWKMGLKQVIQINRSVGHFTQETRWQPEEDKLLRMLWPSASWEALTAALPGRTPLAISLRACRFKIKRQVEKRRAAIPQAWSEDDDNQLKALYTDGVSVAKIAKKIERTEGSVEHRILDLGIKRPDEFRHKKLVPTWQAGIFKVMQEMTSQRHRPPGNSAD
jgi:hypothetical protein